MNENDLPPSSPPPDDLQSGAPEPHPSGLSHDQRLWATFAHLSALLGGFLSSWLAGLGIFLGPLIIWLIKRDTMPFVDDQGKEALNFNITIAIAGLVLLVLTLVSFGLALIITLPLGLALLIFWLIFTIIAAVRANEGVVYRYPVAIRFIQ